MIRSAVLSFISSLSLSACATTSFAPPPVDFRYDGDTSAAVTCKAGGGRGATVKVTRDVPGTYKMLDTFIAAFRCNAHAAANGRQAFQIPAFLATTGAALAGALGGGATYGILGTGANSVFNAGNNYFDPKMKAAYFDHALDAMLCLKTEAVGVPAYIFDNSPPPAAGSAESALFELGGLGKKSTVTVTADEQYFMMVSAAAFSVERILAQRLSNMASVDASAVAAEMAKAVTDATDTAKKRDDAGKGTAVEVSGEDGSPRLVERTVSVSKAELIHLDLAVLKPKLDQCVIRAKL